jgi:glycosyltransferase involved in cell wall biosynthesis
MLEEGAGVGSPVCDVALIGTWNWGPNARGLEWFSAEVVPRLPSTMTVEVAGVGAEWLDGRHPNVAIRGAVHDAEAFLSRARVVAVPSLAGGGIQIKTLDAVACGMPVVATQIATRGIDDWPESVAIAAEASDFANQLERLAISPERERLREEALAWSRARRERLATSVADFSSALTRSIAASAPA